MLIRESEARLASLLAEAGVTPGAVTVVDVRASVEAFRRFASITVADSAPAHEDGDGVLAQFGTYDFRGVRESSTVFGLHRPARNSRYSSSSRTPSRTAQRRSSAVSAHRTRAVLRCID